MTRLNIPSNLEQLMLAQKAVFTEKTKGLGNRLVIMGTGPLARLIAERLGGLPVRIECFCDNNPAKQGTAFMEKPVLAVAEAVRRYNGKAAFVIGIFHSSAADKQLRELNCAAIVTAATLCRHFGPPLTPLASIDYPASVYAHQAEVERCAGIWADEKSRDEYAKVLNWFLAAGQETLVEHEPAAETCFPPDLWVSNDQEHFVDCGAFNGDSVIHFLNRTAFKFGAVTAYEPDPSNYGAFKENIARLPEEARAKIRVANAAVGAKAGKVSFTVSGTAGSSVEADGGLSVKCISLDEELHDVPPTFVKMDIEGYELEALTGGRNIIARHSPILAVTTYHKIEHLWQIPLLIQSFQPEYLFYLRRYAEDCWETVCYAVSRERASKK